MAVSRGLSPLVILGWLCWGTIPLLAQEATYLSDRSSGIMLGIQQGWGDFGYDVATAASGGTGSPLRIGQQTFQRGLGHHASGEIVVRLGGQYTRFQALAGVQWQGGGKGSVVFRVLVDGQVKFEAGPMSDSDAARVIDMPLVGARELRLVAGDGGDGIGCDMANWVEARLDRDPRVPLFGPSAVFFGKEPAPPRSASAGGFSVIAAETGPQVAVMETGRRWTVCVGPGEEVRWTVPVRSLSAPVVIKADVQLAGAGSAEVELSLAGKTTAQLLQEDRRIELATEPAAIDGSAEIALVSRGAGSETAVRWGNLRYVVGGEEFPLPLACPPSVETMPPRELPNLRAPLEEELVQWDWRMQDGIGTERESRTWQQAVEVVLDRGDRLVQALAGPAQSAQFSSLAAQWQSLRSRFKDLSADPALSADPRA
ncbi:MAG: NPCBM/NEW2 domain-containing protein, partial [Thermoguttaceae bacterium]